MVRTFSKMGLAAARIGWMYGPAHLVDAINRIRGPFNVNLPAQLAGAAAARDVEFTARAQRLQCAMARLADGGADLQCVCASCRARPISSWCCFPSPQTANAAFEALMAKGLIVREIGTAYGIPDGLRISIGTEAAMRGVVDVLKTSVLVP